MSIGQDSLINELKSRIKLQEKNKATYDRHMEERLLLWLVSESVKKSSDKDELISNVLERFALVLDISASSCCKLIGNEFIPIDFYKKDSENLEQVGCLFQLSENLLKKLNDGPLIIQKDSDDFDQFKIESDCGLSPDLIAIFPFQSLYIPSGAFLFFDNSEKESVLPGLSVVIDQLLEMVVVKLEKLNLLEELKELNSTFEQKLSKRTEGLQQDIQKLKDELKIIGKTKSIESENTIENIAVEEEEQYSFLKNISVEIRTPINGILGFSEMVRDTKMPEKERDNYIDIIRSCGKSLMKIVDDSVQYAAMKARPLEFNRTEFAIAPFMTELYDKYKKDEIFKLRENLKLRLNININGSTKINVDMDKLQLILTNLIGNAIKYTGEGFVEFGCFISEHKKVKKNQPAAEVVFFVKDSGVGISELHGSKIFDEFYKVEHEISRLYGGLGLGLTITKKLVEEMKGKIWFESEVGKGSAFYFNLPDALVISSVDILNNGIFAVRYDWKDKKILIVEDDLMSFIYLKEVLKSTAAEILHAPDGKKAVEMAARNPDLDIILMDIKLPGISGFEATKQIKNFSEVPVIAQTAYAMADDYKRILQVGCDDYISKPINRKKLLKKIETIFSKHQESFED